MRYAASGAFILWDVEGTSNKTFSTPIPFTLTQSGTNGLVLSSTYDGQFCMFDYTVRRSCPWAGAGAAGSWGDADQRGLLLTVTMLHLTHAAGHGGHQLYPERRAAEVHIGVLGRQRTAAGARCAAAGAGRSPRRRPGYLVAALCGVFPCIRSDSVRE